MRQKSKHYSFSFLFFHYLSLVEFEQNKTNLQRA
jgi:hypothetical protein